MVLGIYGAGGLGREVLLLAEQINNIDYKWNEMIFIEDNPRVKYLKGNKVIALEEVKKISNKDIEIAIAVGEPYFRRLLKERIYDAGFNLATLIHPSVYIPSDTLIEEGTIIGYNCFISCDVIIKENTYIQPCACIGHDSVIGKDTLISTYVSIAGACEIGDETYIGLHVPVKEKVRIGSQTIIGMGSVVMKDIPDQVIALGNPARPMKKNENHRVFS